MERKFQFIIIGAILFFSLVVLFIANTILQLKTEELKQNIYVSTTNKIHSEIDLLMKNKKQSTLALALALIYLTPHSIYISCIARLVFRIIS